jgi:hypothetical protein
VQGVDGTARSMSVPELAAGHITVSAGPGRIEPEVR